MDLSPRLNQIDNTICAVIDNTGLSNRRFDEFKNQCEKLVELLKKLGNAYYIIDLTQPLTKINEGWAYADLKLKVFENSGSMITLEGEIQGYTLRLACSIKHFLDFNYAQNTVNTTSTNHWFFSLKTAYRFRTHFIIVAIEETEKIIYGSPVYLALPAGILTR
jgi:hypothetical protein